MDIKSHELMSLFAICTLPLNLHNTALFPSTIPSRVWHPSQIGSDLLGPVWTTTEKAGCSKIAKSSRYWSINSWFEYKVQPMPVYNHCMTVPAGQTAALSAFVVLVLQARPILLCSTNCFPYLVSLLDPESDQCC